MRILFVCEGNMFRSQVAKALYNLTETLGRAGACGIRPRREGTIGKTLSEAGATNAIKYLRKFGIDASHEVITPISRRLVQSAEKVVVMADKAAWPVYLNSLPNVIAWPIENPNPKVMRSANEVGDQIAERILKLLLRSRFQNRSTTIDRIDVR